MQCHRWSNRMQPQSKERFWEDQTKCVWCFLKYVKSWAVLEELCVGGAKGKTVFRAKSKHVSDTDTSSKRKGPNKTSAGFQVSERHKN